MSETQEESETERTEIEPPVDKPSKVALRRALLTELQWVLAGVIVLSLVVTVGVIAYRQTQGRRLLNDVDRGTNNSQSLLQIVTDCTTPSGDCYKANAANQVAAIGKIELIVVLAASCAKQPENQTVAQISDCVERGLK